MKHYILIGKQVFSCKTLEEWNEWYKHAPRVVARDTVGKSKVSTIFLAMDYGFHSPDIKYHRPLLFETMIFGGDYKQKCWRYHTWEEAEAGHLKAVELCKKGSIDNEQT